METTTTEKQREGSRVKVFWLEQDRLIQVLAGNLEIRGWPADARVVTVHASWERRAVGVLIASETFDVVPHGQIPPDLERETLGRVAVEIVPKEQFGFSHMLVKEGTERLETTDLDAREDAVEHIDWLMRNLAESLLSFVGATKPLDKTAGPCRDALTAWQRLKSWVLSGELPKKVAFREFL